MSKKSLIKWENLFPKIIKIIKFIMSENELVGKQD